MQVLEHHPRGKITFGCSPQCACLIKRKYLLPFLPLLTPSKSYDSAFLHTSCWTLHPHTLRRYIVLPQSHTVLALNSIQLHFLKRISEHFLTYHHSRCLSVSRIHAQARRIRSIEASVKSSRKRSRHLKASRAWA